MHHKQVLDYLSKKRGIRLSILVIVGCSFWVTVGLADEPPPFELPDLAKAERVAQAGAWQWHGTLKGNLPVARIDLQATIQGSGWRLRHSIPMSKNPTSKHPERLLETWEKGDKALLILISGGRPGQTHFLAGLAPNQTNQIQRLKETP